MGLEVLSWPYLLLRRKDLRLRFNRHSFLLPFPVISCLAWDAPWSLFTTPFSQLLPRSPQDSRTVSRFPFSTSHPRGAECRAGAGEGTPKVWTCAIPYGSHQPHVATEPGKCNRTELGHAVSVKYTTDFEALEWKKNVNISWILFYIDVLNFWIYWVK